jgi:hypothetical protein
MFRDCRELVSVTILNAYRMVERIRFIDGVRTVVEEEARVGVSLIGNEAFRDCRSLREVIIPHSVVNIGSSAFRDCRALSEITIPGSVTRIGDSAFRDCRELREITIPHSVVNMGRRAFRDCANLEKAVIGNGLTALDTEIFADCTNLREIIIGNGVRGVGTGVFANCENLESIKFGSRVAPNFEDTVFWGAAESITIFVPLGAKALYETREPLMFYDIVEYDLSTGLAIYCVLVHATLGSDECPHCGWFCHECVVVRNDYESDAVDCGDCAPCDCTYIWCDENEWCETCNPEPPPVCECGDCRECGVIPVPPPVCECGDCLECGFLPVPPPVCECGECLECAPPPLCECNNCDHCGFIGGRFGFGRVTDHDEIPGLRDALAILRFLVNLSSPIAECDDAHAAAMITNPGGVGGAPLLRDALAVLRFTVGLESPVLDAAWRNQT